MEEVNGNDKGTGITDLLTNPVMHEVIRGCRDGKPGDAILQELLDSGVPEEKALYFMSQSTRVARELLSKSSEGFVLGLFIILSGLAVHLINPSRLSINPLGILATCAVIFGLFKCIKHLLDRGSYRTALSNLSGLHMNETRHIIVKGHVQGVFFRATGKEVADSLSITGWIQNAGDDVEIMVSGEPKAIEQFIAWCKKGPPKADVLDVVHQPVQPVIFDEFTVRRRQ